MPFEPIDGPFKCTLRPLTHEEILREMSENAPLADEIGVTAEDIESAKVIICDEDFAHACVAARQRNMSVRDYVHAAFEAYDAETS